jgi:hypothetical protein
LGDDLLSIQGPEELGGPYRISGTFYNRDGALMAQIIENEWIARLENFDVEIVGQTTTVRRGPGDLALVLTVVPRQEMRINRLDMFHRGVRVYTDERGVCIGQPNQIGYAFNAQLLDAAYCLQVIEKTETVPPGAFHIAAPKKRVVRVAQYPGQPMKDWVLVPTDLPGIVLKDFTSGGSPVAIVAEFASQNLVIGRGATWATGDIERIRF